MPNVNNNLLEKQSVNLEPEEPEKKQKFYLKKKNILFVVLGLFLLTLTFFVLNFSFSSDPRSDSSVNSSIKSKSNSIFSSEQDDWVYKNIVFNEPYNSPSNGLPDGLWVFLSIVAGILILAILFYIFGKKLEKKFQEIKLKRIIFKIIKIISLVIIKFYLFIFYLFVYGISLNFVENKNIELFGIQGVFYISALFLLIILLGIIYSFRNKQSRKKLLYNTILFFLFSLLLALFAFILMPTSNSIMSSSYSGGTSSSGGMEFASSLGLQSAGIKGGGILDSFSSSANFNSRAPMTESANLGFAVGGAKDINNFRKNIENDYLPTPTDISYEGIFYDYYFDTGQTEECKKLFCPSYSTAISLDPISGEEEYYLSVGLNSGIKETDFERKKLNLVLVLDISGSMGSSFNKYYYDRFGNKQGIEEDDDDSGKSKMEIAAKSVVALLDHLEDDDRFSMVLFESSAHLAKPLNLVKDTDMQAIKDHILEIDDRGGTNMSAGMKMGTEQFAEYMDINRREYENRIIFLTDAMPNLGDIGEDSLFGITEKNAENGIYSTFIGVGVDFNTELVDKITKTKGSNYYSVHSATEFKQRLDDEFEFMVTPLVFDLKLTLEAEGYEIEKVYGSPEANEATGEIMKVNTLFPSKTVGGETRGGLVLLKLKKTSENGTLVLKTSYLDRQEQIGGDESRIVFKDNAHYDNSGIQKGVLLSRYTNLIKNWIYDERKNKLEPSPRPILESSPVPVSAPSFLMFDYSVDEVRGITMPITDFELGRWEKQSMPLNVSAHYGRMFSKFYEYFNNESKILLDEDLLKETVIMDKLIEMAKDNEIISPAEEDLTRSGETISPEEDLIIGGDQDEHGCYFGAGYTWCESKEKCLREWEEDCTKSSDISVSAEDCTKMDGRILNFDGIISCNEAEKNVGFISDFSLPAFCCVAK